MRDAWCFWVQTRTHGNTTWPVLVNKWKPLADANAGRRQGNKLSVSVLFTSLKRKRGPSCLQITVARGRGNHWSFLSGNEHESNKENNDRHERMIHPLCPTLQNCRRTNYSYYFHDFWINQSYFSVSSQWVLLPSHQWIEERHHLCDKQRQIRITRLGWMKPKEKKMKRSWGNYFRWVSQRVEGFGVLGHLRN